MEQCIINDGSISESHASKNNVRVYSHARAEDTRGSKSRPPNIRYISRFKEILVVSYLVCAKSFQMI